MSLKSYLRQALRAKSFADLRLTDGTAVRIPGDTPAVGDAIVVLDDAGNELGPAPNGTHVSENGYVLTVENGVITAVAETNAAANTEFAALQTQLRTQDHELKQLRSLLEETPGDVPLQPAKPAVAHFHVNTRTHGLTRRTPDSDRIREGIQTLRKAKAGHPEYRFNQAAARRFATGTGVNFNDLLESCASVADELFRNVVIEEGLAQQFNVLDVQVYGSAGQTVELPTLDDTETDTYLQPGIDCTYTAQGTTVLDKRTMAVEPWHYYREYCPKDWGASFRGMRYVNDEEIPYQSVILEFLFSKIRGAWENAILNGNKTAGTAPFDGLLTQIVADAAVPTDQIVPINAPTSNNGVEEFEKILAAIPASLYSNVLEQPLVWLTPNAHLEAYVRNYRASFQALPYNNRFEKFGPDSALITANFFNTAFLATEHIVTPASNLYLGVSGDLDIHVDFHDAGKEQYLFVRVEGHTGVGYPLSNQIILGNV